jgi:mRNA interferase HigB
MKRIVSPKRIRDYARRFPTSKPSLLRWLMTVQHSHWNSPAELKATFNDVDPVNVRSGRTVYVFDIEGNRHRLISAIHFNTQTVYVLRILTHAEYDRNRWKDEL